MDPRLYKAATEGSIQDLNNLIKEDPRLMQSVTPQDNTALHIAARSDHKEFATEILKQFEILLMMVNADGDTPLHIATKAGHLDMVELLINYSKVHPFDVELGQGPLRMTNKQENTALHEAVKIRKSEIAIKLLNADPKVWHMANNKNESPLHLAAKEGLVDVVRKILEHSSNEDLEQQSTLPGPQSPLHYAVIGGHISVVEMLLEKKSDLIKLVDDSGKSALHYAAQINNGKMVEMILGKAHSLAYQNDNEGRSPLLTAAAFNSHLVIKELLKQCPDTAEQVDYKGKNAFHIAVMSGTVGSLKCLLKTIKPKEITNKQDDDGNTPLHLAAKHLKIQSSLLLLKDKRVDLCIVNKEGHTARKVLESHAEMDTYEMYVWKALKKKESVRCGKRPEPTMSRAVRKKIATGDVQFKFSAETYTLVAALIATVTFSAIFTMPGGYDNTHGTAILTKHAAFKAFVISNTIAVCSSLVVVFCFIWAWKDPVRFKLNQLTWGHRLTVVACVAMIISLMTAVYLVVAGDCLWLAIVVILICCSAPFVVWAILGQDVLFIPV